MFKIVPKEIKDNANKFGQSLPERRKDGSLRTQEDRTIAACGNAGEIMTIVEYDLRKSTLKEDQEQVTDAYNEAGEPIQIKTITNQNYGMPADNLQDNLKYYLSFCDLKNYRSLYKDIPGKELKRCRTYIREGRQYIHQNELPQKYRVK